MRSIVMAGGEFKPAPHLIDMLSTAELLVAADSGAVTLIALGFLPDVVVGDFDSVDQTVLDRIGAGGAEVRRYPMEKDASDTELAVAAALERGADDLIVMGALGGPRLDHMLANVMLLALPTLADKRVRMVDIVCI